MFTLTPYNTSNIKNDLLSGTVVAIALVPEAIAFSFVAGLSPIIGLYTVFILGLTTALLGGKPGMISGAAGAIVVVLASLAMTHGLEYVFWSAILTGVIQIAVGAARLGKFIRLVPQPAIFGFVNGLAIVIAMSQFKLFAGEGITMYLLVALTMLIMFFLPKMTKAVPSGLVAIIAVTLIVLFGDLPTKTVGDLADIAGAFPTFSIPPVSLDLLQTVLPYSIIMALVGLIESLLTLSVLDELGGVRGNGNKECIAQGLGNTLCGLFGAMPGCAMIGQSIINFTSGGLTRLSSATAAILVILFVISLSGIISQIAVAALVGIMFMVSLNTFEWASISRLKRMKKTDAFVLVAVTLITIFSDLAVAVISGVIISALAFAWEHAKITVKVRFEEDGTKIYELDGPLFFGSATRFANDIFTVAEDPHNVILDFSASRVMDSSGVEAIDKVSKLYLDAGKRLRLRHLSEDCIAALRDAGPYCTHELDNPTYKVARNI
ncbi:MAG: SulP family inorganic anion transporter [Sulfuricurvum sp.]